MNSFLLQYNNINVVLEPIYKKGRMEFKINYDESELKKNGISKKQFEIEINQIIQEPSKEPVNDI